MLSTSSQPKKTLCGQLLLVAMMGWIGCGCSQTASLRQSVEGTVSLDGKPVSGLTLVFTPVEGEQLGAAAEVVDGKFSLPASVGPSVGKHHVTVSVNQPDLEDFETLRVTVKQPFIKLPLHPKYSKPGELEADVTANGSNVFEFQLGRR